jgi:hypothetical protein
MVQHQEEPPFGVGNKEDFDYFFTLTRQAYTNDHELNEKRIVSRVGARC